MRKIRILPPSKLSVEDRDSLRAFQKRHRLQADGKYGTQTHNFMLALIDALRAENDELMHGNEDVRAPDWGTFAAGALAGFLLVMAAYLAA